MKRTVEVTTRGYNGVIRITAEVTSSNGLTRDEVSCARDELADRLMEAVAGVQYFRTPLSKVRVR